MVVVLAYYAMSLSGDLQTANSATDKTKQQLEASQKEVQNLNATCLKEKTECKEALKAKEERLADLESTLANTQNAFGELRDEKIRATKELAQFKKFANQFQSMIDAGKLDVVFRRGRMVVNLPAQVLFDSGSADLSEEGAKALVEVASILRKVKGKNFIVGGHTDNEKIQKSQFASNWELSTARALVVTRTLIKAGMNSSDLVAAGYSQFAPIASNKTAEGRRRNRRIEIILEPYLKDITPPSKKSKAEPSAKKVTKAKPSVKKDSKAKPSAKKDSKAQPSVKKGKEKKK